jgi:hypothetical protein
MPRFICGEQEKGEEEKEKREGGESREEKAMGE